MRFFNFKDQEIYALSWLIVSGCTLSWYIVPECTVSCFIVPGCSLPLCRPKVRMCSVFSSESISAILATGIRHSDQQYFGLSRELHQEISFMGMQFRE